MGICAGKASAEQINQRRKDKAIDDKLRDMAHEDEKKIKLLLLGAGESGKSTIFKQMAKIYSEVLDEAEYEKRKKEGDGDTRDQKPIIHSNIVQSMAVLVGESCNTDETKALLDPENKEIFDKWKSTPNMDDAQWTFAMAEEMEKLWADPAIQEAYSRKNHFQLNDSAAYYFRKLDVIKDENWLPSSEDCMKARVRTSGIVERTFAIPSDSSGEEKTDYSKKPEPLCHLTDQIPFVMFDVGGQRNERKKWIHCFDNVTSVIFVAAISEYDQMLYEDNTENRMTEALNLFEEMYTSQYFKKISFIMFLNKRDLLMEKLYVNKARPPTCDASHLWKEKWAEREERGFFDIESGMDNSPSFICEKINETSIHTQPGYACCEALIKETFSDKWFEHINIKDEELPELGKDYGETCAFFLDLFMDICVKEDANKKGGDEGGDRQTYWHITCATDTANVETVFKSCKDIIIRANLDGMGL